MSRALPYRVADPDSVRAGAWLLEKEPGIFAPLPPHLPDWDYATDLRLRRDLEIDVAEVRLRAGLDNEIQLAVGVLWTSDQHLRGRSAVTPVEGESSVAVSLDFDLVGWQLGAVLTLETRLYLMNEGPENPGPVAHRPGSELWADQQRVALQGSSARFPVALVDPSRFGLDVRAPWFLKIRPEIATPALGAVQLLVNEKNELARNAVESPTGSETSAAVTSTMRYDIGRALVEFALGHDELWDGTEFEEDSLAVSLQLLLKRLFPNESPSVVRGRRETDPAGYAADLAGALGLLGDGQI